jgi:putative spermidine/putrescine transport system ATP-binding protein
MFLELNNIRKAFGNTVAVDNFNLQVKRGEFLSFLGPSGCGKTTTMRMIAGFEMPTLGSIHLDDKDITHISPTKRKVGMVFQSYALFPHLNARDNIGFGLKIAGKTKDEIYNRVDEMLELIKMMPQALRFPHQLSGGQQQRVALARALAVRPQVLLLDEPLSALDAKIRESLRTEIRAIQQQLGITTIYVTHDQEEALSISDRVVVMNTGRIEQIGTPLDIYTNPATPFVAGFVGTMNFIPAKIKSGRGDVQCGQLSLQLGHHASQFSVGSLVNLALRPEELRVFAENSDQPDCFTATIQSAEFMGTTYRLNLVTTALGENGASSTLLAELPANYVRNINIQPSAALKVQLPVETMRVFSQ